MIAMFLLVMLQKPEMPASFPDAPGKKLIERTCLTACHGTENVLKKRRTKELWDKQISDMAEKGAKATDDEFDTIVEYLGRYYGQVNVNKAAAKDLQEVLDLTPEEAAAIVKYREANGGLKTVDEIEKVPGLDGKKMNDRKPRILVK
jgi:competence protein ComEA